MSKNTKYCLFETSENGFFKVNPLKRNVLYIRSDILNEKEEFKFLEKINANTSEGIPKLKKYSIFKYCNDLFDVKDEIEFTKSLVLQQYNTNCVFKEKTTGIVFDNTYKNNSLIIEKVSYLNKNNKAYAKENECFGIVRGLSNENKIKDHDIESGNYHVSYILFKDGNSYVTIEINKFNQPSFEFYSDKDTFHDKHKNDYLPDPTTVVLEKENIVMYNLNDKIKDIQFNDKDLNLDSNELKLSDPDKIELNISELSNESEKISLDLNDDLEIEQKKETIRKFEDIEENKEDNDYIDVETNKNNDNVVVSLVKKIKNWIW